MGRLPLEQNVKTGQNRRSFLRSAGLGGGVLALAPLAASLSGASAAEKAAAAGGKYDFDNIANRVGHDSVKWDGGLRNEHVKHLVAGMDITDMDFKAAPTVTAARRGAGRGGGGGGGGGGRPGRRAGRGS